MPPGYFNLILDTMGGEGNPSLSQSNEDNQTTKNDKLIHKLICYLFLCTIYTTSEIHPFRMIKQRKTTWQWTIKLFFYRRYIFKWFVFPLSYVIFRGVVGSTSLHKDSHRVYTSTEKIDIRISPNKKNLGKNLHPLGIGSVELSHRAASERSWCRVSFKAMAFKMLAASRVEKKTMEETNSFEFPIPIKRWVPISYNPFSWGNWGYDP